MAKNIVKCFICGNNVDLNGQHYMIICPDGKERAVHNHIGVSKHGGIEVNAPKKETSDG